MELQKGKTPFSEGTFECENESCWYNQGSRCIFNIARLQMPTGKACYEELRDCEIEAELDHADGLL